MKKITNKALNTKIYIGRNYTKDYINELKNKNRRIFCIIDNKLRKQFKDTKNSKIKNIYFPGGEGVKNISHYNLLCNKLLEKEIDRKSILICIGGGTLGDLCGFVAGTILRGIEFILVPTTLLAQVDSSIGGKNGINTNKGKNLLGTFYQPKEVLIDTIYLKTLPKREIKSGYSEIIKHALIYNFNFFKWLEKNYEKVISLKANILENAIYKSLKIKLFFVEKDFNEKLKNKNSRAMLNFGHTFGHALETYYRYKRNINHGEAISIGMIVEAKISNYFGYLSKRNLETIINHFKKADLKTFDSNIKNKNIFKIIIKDKKNYDGQINIILLKNIGKSIYVQNLGVKKLKEFIQKI